ncbi:hypothetical protein P280DRAFT_519756 [Massarina eburnea CBS 473.64]|uniref:C2H2-type domain-containing protein n=1 Tax=Massarina eburnea CBS 473.64 TaxID=1395130 RepID=A0A6A6RV57_9PLEO|nr:hypothetical protein P280DRAFT_519756 [Massarina eburnea CBS 473.64]
MDELISSMRGSFMMNEDGDCICGTCKSTLDVCSCFTLIPSEHMPLAGYHHEPDVMTEAPSSTVTSPEDAPNQYYDHQYVMNPPNGFPQLPQPPSQQSTIDDVAILQLRTISNPRNGYGMDPTDQKPRAQTRKNSQPTPFQCEDCKKYLSKKGNLTRHHRETTCGGGNKKKPCLCPVENCDQASTRPCNLKTHLFRCHRKCKRCGLSLPDSQAIVQHEKDKHQNKSQTARRNDSLLS